MYWCSKKEAVFVYYYIQHYKKPIVNITTEFIITGYSNIKRHLNNLLIMDNLIFTIFQWNNRNSIKDVMIYINFY